MAEVLACRACRRPLVAEGGCAICTDIKRNLVVEGDTENVPLAKLAGDTVRLLKTDLYRLELMQAKDRVYNPTLAAEGRRLSGAIAKLLDSTRKVIQDGVDAVEALSFQERAEILVAWFETLPPAYRRKIFEDLAKLVGPPVVEPSDRSDRHPTIPTRARS